MSERLGLDWRLKGNSRKKELFIILLKTPRDMDQASFMLCDMLAVWQEMGKGAKKSESKYGET